MDFKSAIKVGIWYTLLNSIFVFLISSKYFTLLFHDVASQHIVYSVCSCFTHFLAISFLPFLFVFLPLLWLTNKYRLTQWVTIIFSMVALVVLTIDSYVFSLYRFHIDSYVIEQVFGPASGQVFEVSVGLYLLVVGVIIALLLVEWGVFKMAEYIEKKISEKLSRRFLYGLLFVWLALFAFVQVFRMTRTLSNDRSIAVIERHYPLMVIPSDIIGFLKHKEGDLDNMYCSFVYPDSAKLVSVDVPTNNNEAIGSATHEKSNGRGKMNVLVITLDSWRATTMDSLSCPNIYEFSKKAQVYEKHYSGSNGTRTGVFSLFYGLPGTYFRTFGKHRVEPLLMKKLREEEYDIKLFPSASLRNPPLDKTVFLSYQDQCDPTEGENAWQRDSNLAKNFLSYLAKRDTTCPFFSFLFFDSLHSMIKPSDFDGPFQPSWDAAHYERLGRTTNPTEFFNLYRNMVSYLDNIVGEILISLRERGLMDNTIIILTGDHAQEFNDNKRGYWGHNGNYSAAQLHVPFIYYVPKNNPRKFNHWTAHYDVVPTLLRDALKTEGLDLQNLTKANTIGKLLDDTTERKNLFVDSYIGYGMIDTDGKILNVYYDGDMQMTNAQLREDFDSPLDTVLFKQAEANVKFLKEIKD